MGDSSEGFDLVVFDCDGVLVDSERLVVEIESRLLTELGWPITVAEIVERFMGRSDGVMSAEVERRLGPSGAAEFDRLATAEVRRALETRLVEVPGARAAVTDVVAAGTSTCVASGGSHRKIRTTLGVTGLWSLFEGRVFSAEDVAHGKPSPDLFLHAAAAMGADPGRCAVVEDSVFGIEAAMAAGMTPFGFGGGLLDGERLADAGATVFAHMDELGRLLAGGGGRGDWRRRSGPGGAIAVVVGGE